MPLSLDERIANLQRATATGPALEQLMLRERVIGTFPNGTRHAGASTTFLVVFESRRQGIHKPFAKQNPTSCSLYGQSPHEAVLHEVVAWRLATRLGEPWSQLVPTAVLRDVVGAGAGALINWREGAPNQAVFDKARGQTFAAAFWDALIGQQDRHLNNFRYDEVGRRLALIDNAFAFARPGDIDNSSLFLSERRRAGGSALTSTEKDRLEDLLASEDLWGLRTFLEEDRADALAARAERMLEMGFLPLPGDF